jgi:serine/threonine protein kinase
MESERSKKIKALLLEAAALQHDARRRFLETACRDDPTMLVEVECLLDDMRTRTQTDRVSETETLDPRLSQPTGDYRLVRRIGHGGMGTVWEAEQRGNGRRVALKLLSTRLVKSPRGLQRFLREGQLAANVSHPRSTFVFEAGTDGDVPFIVMELMPGRTLADVIAGSDGRLPTERAVDFILDVLDGLEAAHAAGVIHRDVKPSNCFVDSDGRIKVGD